MCNWFFFLSILTYAPPPHTPHTHTHPTHTHTHTHTHTQCANIGPADYNYDETISTLRYANRAKNIKNKARINEDPKDALLRQFQKEIEELKKKLVEGNEPESKK